MKTEAFLEELLKLPGMVEPQVSPDGKWVAWSWFRVGPAADIYLAPCDGSQPPIRMTATPENTFLVSWSFDSKAIVVEQDTGGDERIQLFKIDIDDPQNMLPLTEPSPHYYISGGVLTPDAQQLIYGANYNFDLGEEIEPTYLYLHDLLSGEKKILAKPLKAHHYRPKLNSQGTKVLYSRADLHPAGEQVWLVDLVSGEDREILNFGDSAKITASWHPEGEKVIFLTEAENYRQVGMYDLETKVHSWLIDDATRNLEGVFIPHNSFVGVVIEVVNAGIKPSFFNLTTLKETKLPSIEGNLIPLAPVGDGEWVGMYYSSTQPADLVRFNPENFSVNSFLSLSRVWERTTLKASDFTKAREICWQAKDGLMIKGWFYQVKNPSGTIICVHGGPTAHSEDRIALNIQFLTSQGFNVLDPNYRGSTGYGLDFQVAIKEDGWGGAEQEDIRSGIKHLLDNGLAKPGKIGMTGTSYGGYSSWYALTHFEKELLAAAVPICGMTDLVIDYETTRPDLKPYSEEMMGGSPSSIPQKYYERSPINYLSNLKGKLLIVQGLRDPNVTPENVRVVREKLDKYNIKYEVLTFEDEGHGINKPKNMKVLLLEMNRFFKTALSD